MEKDLRRGVTLDGRGRSKFRTMVEVIVEDRNMEEELGKEEQEDQLWKKVRCTNQIVARASRTTCTPFLKVELLLSFRTSQCTSGHSQ